MLDVYEMQNLPIIFLCNAHLSSYGIFFFPNLEGDGSCKVSPLGVEPLPSGFSAKQRKIVVQVQSFCGLLEHLEGM